MEWLQTLAVLFVLAALFRCINERYLNLQNTVAIMVLGVGCLVVSALLGWAEVGVNVEEFVDLIDDADPSRFMWMSVLAILMFATTMQASILDLANEKWFALGVAAVTLIIGTAVIGNVLPFALEKIDVDISTFTGYLFGAIISVSCLSVMVEVMKTPPNKLVALASGEALFMVALSAVVCAAIAKSELGDGGEFSEAGGTVLRELSRAGLIGAVIGAAGYFVVPWAQSVYGQLLVSLAVVYTACAVGARYEGFWPVAAATSGLVLAMRTDVRKQLAPIWRGIEETVTAMLLIVIGAQFAASSDNVVIPIVVAIFVAVVGRGVAVLLANQLLGIDRRIGSKRWDVVKYMTWGAVHGGVPLALAMTIPHEGGREFVFMVFGVVAFSLAVQATTVNKI